MCRPRRKEPVPLWLEWSLASTRLSLSYSHLSTETMWVLWSLPWHCAHWHCKFKEYGFFLSITRQHVLSLISCSVSLIIILKCLGIYSMCWHIDCQQYFGKQLVFTGSTYSWTLHLVTYSYVKWTVLITRSDNL